MSTYYLRVDSKNHTRKILIDMAYLAKHKIIRLPKYYFEEGLYLPFKSNSEINTIVEKFELTRNKIFKEDNDFYYFKFPFKHHQVVDAAV